MDGATILSLVPGYLGITLRRCFYWGTLAESHWDLFMGFGSFFTHAGTRVGRNVLVGAYTLIGTCRVGDHVRIGSRVSLLSGRRQHGFRRGSMEAFDERVTLQEIELGEGSWIAEGAVVMADLGRNSGVGAGAVVVKPVPSGVIVAGNPARPIGSRVEEGKTNPGSEVERDQ
jgi:acetyltransferase-like isoleucine patch superfamily enzyme